MNSVGMQWLNYLGTNNQTMLLRKTKPFVYINSWKSKPNKSKNYRTLLFVNNVGSHAISQPIWAQTKKHSKCQIEHFCPVPLNYEWIGHSKLNTVIKLSHSFSSPYSTPHNYYYWGTTIQQPVNFYWATIILLLLCYLYIEVLKTCISTVIHFDYKPKATINNPAKTLS